MGNAHFLAVCQVRLAVDVHKQHRFLSEGKPCGNIDRRGGFRYTAFFIGNADDGWFFVLFHLILSFQKTKAIRLQKISDSLYNGFGGQFVHLYREK